MGFNQRPNKLKCLYANLQSLINKKKEIEMYLENDPCDILFFTEIWVESGIDESEICIDGYQSPIIDYHSRGGTCVYVKNGLNYSTVEPPIKMEQSVYLVIRTSNNVSRLYACVYRSPNSTEANDDKLLRNVSWARESFPEVVFVGDFNAPRVDWTSDAAASSFGRKLVDCVNDNYLEQCVDKPTRYRLGQIPSLLDLIITSDPEIVSNVSVQEPFGKCDHCMILFDVKNEKCDEESHRQFLDFENIDNIKFEQIMAQYNWNEMFSDVADMNASYELFLSTVQNAIKECTPVINSRKRRKAPWATRQVKKLSKKKRKMWHKYKNSLLQSDYELYKSALNTFNDEKSRAILNFENNIIANKNTNLKKYYAYISKKNKYSNNKVCLKKEDGLEIEEKKCADILNDYFGSVFTKGDSIPQEFVLSQEIPDMRDIVFNVNSIENKLKLLDPKKASGPDEIPCFVLKRFSYVFGPILTAIFEKSHKEGVVPLQMKKANIVPLFKSGDRCLPENYRPVSLTPIIAKTLESCVYDLLLEHVDANNIISEKQHGFRRGRSTNSNLLSFWEEISKLANEGKEISIIYTDLRKAFDSVPHDLLLMKLRKYGVRSSNLAWIASFLAERQQKVVINGKYSHSIHAESGVPQGGVLSGLLFNLYINDMPNGFEYVRTAMYADDAKLYAPVTDHHSCQRIQNDLDTLASWCQKWRLRLNAGKCFLLHYVPQNRTSINPQYKICDVVLQRKPQTSDLGIIVSENLKFHDQVQQSCKKATREINRIRRTFSSRNPEFLSTMFKMFVRPHLEYCVQVWNPVYGGDIETMEKTQNRFTRLLRHGIMMSLNERNLALNLQDHKTRRTKGDLIYIYKMYDCGFFIPVGDTRTRGHSKKLKIQQSRNNIRKHSFSIRNVTIWNELPESVVTAENVNLFKARLDEHMKFW